jgi:integrase
VASSWASGSSVRVASILLKICTVRHHNSPMWCCARERSDPHGRTYRTVRIPQRGRAPCLLGGNLNRAFKAALQRAGLPELRFHDLRHTCATLLLRQGVNPKCVQELLGYADISLTLNVYSHVLPDMGDAAAGAIPTQLMLRPTFRMA